MKKYLNVILAAAMLSAGCAASSTGSSSAESSEEVVYSEVADDAYSEYKDSIENAVEKNSWTASVRCRYDLAFSDDTSITYALDGTLEVENAADPTAHITQHINSNGMTSEMEGYYYGGRLYNEYNGITYYEDMKLQDLKSSMLIPMEPKAFSSDQCDEVTKSAGSDGSIAYTVALNAKSASSIFTSRYDQYALNEYDDYTVESGIITDIFDEAGHFIGENAVFNVKISYSGEVVNVSYEADCDYIRVDETEILLSEEQKEEQNSYVSFSDIDTDAITTEETVDDSAEATVTETFKKRLVSRLGYSVQDDGSYETDFNTNEAYVINFDNYTFEFSNYSITYSYSWKNDVGSMGACTYTFESGATSTSCEDSTLETIKDVKSYLEMELYYCGLSLDDLQEEARN